jgi:enolase
MAWRKTTEGWAMPTQTVDSHIHFVGDDLFVTNTKILRIGVQKYIASSLLIKINQIGMLTRSLRKLQFAGSL